MRVLAISNKSGEKYLDSRHIQTLDNVLYVGYLRSYLRSISIEPGSDFEFRPPEPPLSFFLDAFGSDEDHHNNTVLESTRHC
jgi:hypothetical protein